MSLWSRDGLKGVVFLSFFWREQGDGFPKSKLSKEKQNRGVNV
jgi:hypothetical protein